MLLPSNEASSTARAFAVGDMSKGNEEKTFTAVRTTIDEIAALRLSLWGGGPPQVGRRGALTMKRAMVRSRWCGLFVWCPSAGRGRTPPSRAKSSLPAQQCCIAAFNSCDLVVGMARFTESCVHLRNDLSASWLGEQNGVFGVTDVRGLRTYGSDCW